MTFDDLNKGMQAIGRACTMEGWLEGKPEQVQRLAKEFPLGTYFVIEGDTYFLIGYGEGDADVLLVSPDNPGKDYEKALQNIVRLCAVCVREGETDPEVLFERGYYDG